MTVTINGSGPVSGVTTLGMTSGTITGLTAGGLPDASVTQPDLAAGVAGNGPAFSAYLGTNQTVSANTFVKMQANTKEFDTASCYDASTNYRFTPNVAGYYQVSGHIFFNASTSVNGNTVVSIFKNGSRFKDGIFVNGVTSSTLFLNVAALIYLNGTTDYIELYGLVNGTGTLSFYHDASTNYGSYFQAALVRAA